MSSRTRWFSIGVMFLLLSLVLFGCQSNQGSIDTDEYRIIQIVETSGHVTIEREGVGSLDAYPKMKLQNADKVSVAKDSYARLILDNDKYVYVEPNTVFSLEASGTSKQSYTNIKLEKGAITNEIQKPLSAESQYKIETPNSTMSVRGTVYYVRVDVNKEVSYTTLKVFDGKVETKLFHEDGKETDPVMVSSGKGVKVHGEEDLREYVVSDMNEIETDIKLEELDDDTLETLYEISLNEDRLFSSHEEIKEEIETRKKVNDEEKEPVMAPTPEPPTQYLIRFYNNATLINEQALYANEEIAYPTTQRAGYSFRGWYTEPECRNHYTSQGMPSQNVNLYAKWAPNDVTLTLNDRDIIESKVYKVDSKLNLPTLQRSGYSFHGWYQDKEGTKKFESTTMPTKNTTLYAKWTANTNTPYKVNHYFEKVNGGYDVESISYEGTTDTLVNAPAISKVGFTFDGTNNSNVISGNVSGDGSFILKMYYQRNIHTLTWKLNNGEGDVVSDVRFGSTITAPTPTRIGYTFTGWDSNVATTMPDEDITYTAQWEINPYTITFDSNGGTSVENQTKNYDSIVDQPQEPTRTGYTFAGWYKEESCTNLWDFATDKVPANNITLYAKWDVNTYNVTLDSNGGSIADGKNVTIYTYGQGAVLPTSSDISKTGYSFAGWYDNPSYTGTAVTEITETDTKNKTYYAKWTANTNTQYKVNYYFEKVNGGYDVESIPYVGTTDSLVNAPTISKVGFTFDETNNSNVISGNVSGDGSFVLKMYYQRNIHTLTWKLNNGEGDVVSDVRFGSTITAPTPTRIGYTFTGWDSNVATTMPDEDITYTAKWDVIHYGITYDLDGGSLENEIIDYTIETGDFNLPTPTKLGYTFVGWSGSNGEAAQTNVIINQGSTGDKSYLAHWQANEYTYNIVYRSGSGADLGTSTINGYYGSNHTINAPNKAGYQTPDAKEVSFDSVDTKTIVFTYQTISYDITYDLDGGSLSGQSAQYTIETEYTLPTPTKEGYTFGGWYTNSEFTDSKVDKINRGSTGDKTYYAKWYKNYTYTLVYADETSESFTVNESMVIDPANWTKKSGNNFIGWSTSDPLTNTNVGLIGTDAFSLSNDMTYYEVCYVDYVVKMQIQTLEYGESDNLYISEIRMKGVIGTTPDLNKIAQKQTLVNTNSSSINAYSYTLPTSSILCNVNITPTFIINYTANKSSLVTYKVDSTTNTVRNYLSGDVPIGLNTVTVSDSNNNSTDYVFWSKVNGENIIGSIFQYIVDIISGNNMTYYPNYVSNSDILSNGYYKAELNIYKSETLNRTYHYVLKGSNHTFDVKLFGYGNKDSIKSDIINIENEPPIQVYNYYYSPISYQVNYDDNSTYAWNVESDMYTLKEGYGFSDMDDIVVSISKCIGNISLVKKN